MSNEYRVVVLFSGEGTNLQSIIDLSMNGSRYQVVGAVSNKYDVGGIKRAEAANIPVAIVPHDGYDSREEYDSVLCDEIDRFKPDLIVMAGFMRILTSVFVERFRGKAINIHPSLLPKYTGLNTYERAKKAGDSECGCTVHFVTDDLDAGPIIHQVAVPMKLQDSIPDLIKRVQQAEHAFFSTVVIYFARGRLKLLNDVVMFDDKALPPTGICVSFAVDA